MPCYMHAFSSSDGLTAVMQHWAGGLVKSCSISDTESRTLNGRVNASSMKCNTKQLNVGRLNAMQGARRQLQQRAHSGQTRQQLLHMHDDLSFAVKVVTMSTLRVYIDIT